MKRAALSSLSAFGQRAAGILIALLALQLALVPALGGTVSAAPGAEILPGSVTLHEARYPIGPGAWYELYHLQVGTVPQRVHVVRVPSGDPFLHLELSLPGGQLQGRETVGSHAVRSSTPDRPVIAAINGDFFFTEAGYNGVPTGVAITGGQLVRDPWGPAFGLLENGSAIFGLPEWSGTVRILAEGQLMAEHPLDRVNSPRGTNQLVLFTPDFGGSTGTNIWGTELLVEGLSRCPVTGRLTGGIAPAEDVGDNPISSSTGVLSGHGSAATFLKTYALPGHQAEISWAMSDPWQGAVEAVGGRPVLLREGVILPDGLTPAPVSDQAAPRSGVAVAADGTRLLVAVDGRQPGYSAGLSIEDFAILLKRLGAVDAINLDGGGSTTLLRRQPGEEETTVANRPSDGRSRAVGNALLVMSSAPRMPASQLFIEPLQGPILSGASVPVRVSALDPYANPAPLPAGQITWQVEGAQGSVEEERLITSAPGRGRLVASLGGIRGETPLTVVGPEDVSKVQVNPTEIRLQPGKSVSLSVRLLDEIGRVVQAEVGLWSWEVGENLGKVAIDSSGREVFLAGDKDMAGTISLILGEHRVSVPVTVGDPPPFADVAGHWALAAIREMALRGVATGYGDGTFLPDRDVTRAEFAKMVTSAVGLEVPADLHLPFTDDIPTWARPYVAAAHAAGVIRGYPDGTFRPHATVTRAEMAAMMVRAIGAQTHPEELSEFPDEVPVWAVAYVNAVTELGLIRGFPDGTFRAGDPATRAQSCTVMWRLVDLT